MTKISNKEKKCFLGWHGLREVRFISFEASIKRKLTHHQNFVSHRFDLQSRSFKISCRTRKEIYVAIPRSSIQTRPQPHSQNLSTTALRFLKRHEVDLHEFRIQCCVRCFQSNETEQSRSNLRNHFAIHLTERERRRFSNVFTSTLADRTL